LRRAEIKRTTKETDIKVVVNLDGKGEYEIDTKIGFLNHMLEIFSKHSKIDLKVVADGDIDVDFHHTVEDVGISLGMGINEALGEKRGINRYGFFVLPMDETLIECAIDLSGRPCLNFHVEFFTDKIGGFPVELVEEFFKAFSDNLKCNLHIIKRYGKNSHHIVEGVFKAVARSLNMAVDIKDDAIPSTKGVL